MKKSNAKIKVSKPKSILTKPLNADFPELFKALGKGIGHAATGNWDDISADTVDALYAIGLSTEPGELGFLLIQRSLTKALFELVGESASHLLATAKTDSELSTDELDLKILGREIHFDRKFLDRPADQPLIQDVQTLLRSWLEKQGISTSAADAVSNRLPAYFVYSLNQEWRQNEKSYRPLLDALDTPFAKAGEREWAWAEYSALLRRRTEESVFDEPFSLRQIYIPLNAYYFDESRRSEANDDMTRTGRHRRRIVVKLVTELEKWIQTTELNDSIRVISGGPGSGKSSFVRIFAAKISQEGKTRVLFVPLHLIDPTKDLVEEVGRFVQDEGLLLQNPLDPESPEPNLLVIFDGLDELASQGKAAAETARAFVREIERTAARRNQDRVKLRFLISGRELAVQENESEFRRPRQVLNLLPYFVPKHPHYGWHFEGEGEEYSDPSRLLKHDLRQKWWTNYGNLTGKKYTGLPQELSRSDLAEVTSQPLLNYLVALSFTRDKLDFNQDINLNSIYEDLVAAVHERGYEKGRWYAAIRHMDAGQFSRVLAEVGLAAWHGDGRTTTVREIEAHCHDSGLGALLDVFQEGAKAGVTRLLAAFFFRQYGHRVGGDPTFVFTHKSFGEYLTAKRVVLAIKRVAYELKSRENDPDRGWDEREALRHWIQVCGPAAMTRYLHSFVLSEVKLHSSAELRDWQMGLEKLFSHVLRRGMPMELVQLNSFREACFQSRNAEESLLIALNACARITRRVSLIHHPDRTSFGAWFKRIQGQRTSGESVLAAECLSFLHLRDAIIHVGDFYGANLSYSDLSNIHAAYCCFSSANLQEANLSGAWLINADFREANLEKARLSGADLIGAELEGANVQDADLGGARLKETDDGTNLRRANRAVATADETKGAAPNRAKRQKRGGTKARSKKSAPPPETTE